MKTINDWKIASAQIEKYLSDSSIRVSDFYLVGSKVDNENSNSDFDSLIIIDGYSHEISDLRKLRKGIDDYIVLENINELYHYKLFNIEELKALETYDGFRLADFQKRNLSVKNSGILNAVEPKLNMESLANSFLIQLVHKFIYQLNIPNLEEIYKKLQFWLEFNLDINEIVPKNEATFQYFLDNDLLTSQFWNLFHSDKKENSQLRALLTDYFERLRHESINKYDVYFKMTT